MSEHVGKSHRAAQNLESGCQLLGQQDVRPPCLGPDLTLPRPRRLWTLGLCQRSPRGLESVMT